MRREKINRLGHDSSDHANTRFQTNSDPFRNAIESLPHPFYVIDVDSHVIQIANSATEKLGEIREGATCYELTHRRTAPCSGQLHQCPIALIKKYKKPVTLEHIHFDKNGAPRIFEIHGSPIFDKEGNVGQIIEYSLDITDRKKTEEALKTAHDSLEKRVRKRTRETEQINAALHKEIAEHRETEKKLIAHQQKLRSIASDLTIAEERQRRQIATDLHDSIGQALAISQMKLSQVQGSVKDKDIAGQLREIQALLEDAVQHTRTMTFEISPPLLYDIGLDAALEWLTETFQEKYNINTTFLNEKSEKIKDDDVRLMLYRIARELLINVIKHASADHVSVAIRNRDQAIQIEIIDDGVGFDPQNIIKRNHHGDGFGLFSIGERLKFIGGEFYIKSEPGHGAQVLISAPLRKTIAQ